MDQIRQIRFLIPPFFFFASLTWGAYLDDPCRVEELFRDEVFKSIGALLLAGASVISLGFLIGSVSIVALALGSWLLTGQHYEVAGLSEACLSRIWTRLDTGQHRERASELYAVVTFDHELLSKGVHEWLLRRWSTFNVSAHSIMALLLAHVAGGLLGVNQGIEWWRWFLPIPGTWWATTLVLWVVLMFMARASWRETKGMIDFQSHRGRIRPQFE